MNACGHCGANVNDGFNVCGGCGANLRRNFKATIFCAFVVIMVGPPAIGLIWEGKWWGLIPLAITLWAAWRGYLGLHKRWYRLNA